MLEELKTRLQLWWLSKTLIEGRDYKVEVVEDSGVLVTFLTGEYRDMIITFTNLIVSEDGRLDFVTRVMYNPKAVNVYTNKFNMATANILRMLLHEAVRDTTKVQSNEDREIDTSEPDEEREFHEESSPVLEKRVSKRKSRKKASSGD